jgi:LEA14-like dessication related protein
MRAGLLAVLLIALTTLSGCATLQGDFDPPKVSLESFSSLPSESGAPRFEIKLRIINPNKQTLDIAGISYSVELLGKELITGVTSDVPVIEGYSEEIVSMEAGLQLFQLLRLLGSLGRSQSDVLDYRLLAKVDFNGLIPTQRIEESGQISLNGSGT